MRKKLITKNGNVLNKGIVHSSSWKFESEKYIFFFSKGCCFFSPFCGLGRDQRAHIPRVEVFENGGSTYGPVRPLLPGYFGPRSNAGGLRLPQSDITMFTSWNKLYSSHFINI